MLPPDYPDLQLSETQLSVVKSSSATVEITAGSGEYGVTNLNSSVAKATLLGTTITISAVAEGEAKVVATDMQSGQQIIIEITVTGGGDIPSYTSCPDNNHPHLIDLGLPSGTKWACCNVGANKPEEFGGYYAWGETATKNVYTEAYYKYAQKKGNTYYYINLGKDIASTKYDAATANWGSPWVMPSLTQCQELINNCYSTYTDKNGVNGRKFTGPNGASIFFPAAGWRYQDQLYQGNWRCYIWSSTLNELYNWYACTIQLLDESEEVQVQMSSYGSRFSGRSVRPVRKN